LRQGFVESSDGNGFVSTLANTREERPASSNDLVTDLAYVVLLAQVGHVFRSKLEDEDSSSYLAWRSLCALFIPIWFQWLWTQSFLNRFEQSDAIFFVIFVCNLALAAAFGSCTTGCGEGADRIGDCAAFCKVVSAGQAFLALLHMYAGCFDRFRRPTIWFELVMPNLVAACLWQMPAVVGSHTAFIATWGIAIASEGLHMLVILPSVRHKCLKREQGPASRVCLNLGLWAERQQLFIILSLGEILVSAVKENERIPACMLVVVLAAVLKGLYFDLSTVVPLNTGSGQSDFDHAMRATRARGMLWTYSHLPLNIFLVAVGGTMDIFLEHGATMNKKVASNFACALAGICFTGTLADTLHVYKGSRRLHAGSRYHGKMVVCARLAIATLIALLPHTGLEYVAPDTPEHAHEQAGGDGKTLVAFEIVLLVLFSATGSGWSLEWCTKKPYDTAVRRSIELAHRHRRAPPSPSADSHLTDLESDNCVAPAALTAASDC
jgi:low temperature requirement protein LtrA